MVIFVYRQRQQFIVYTTIFRWLYRPKHVDLLRVVQYNTLLSLAVNTNYHPFIQTQQG